MILSTLPRQGHLSMVIVLMRYGSNPYILDGEGVNCLHIAAQLGFTDITAYYIAKGMVGHVMIM